MDDEIRKKDTPNKLSRLQKDLYNPASKQESSIRRSFLTPEEISIAHKFDNEIDLNDPTLFAPKAKKQNSVWSIVFWVALVFFLGAALFTYTSFRSDVTNISNEKIALSSSQFDYVDGGQEFDFVVSITNTNPTALTNAVAVVEYPELNVQAGKDTNFISHNLGTIGINEIRNETFKLKLYGQSGDKKKITFGIKYNIASSSENFEKYMDSFVTINSTPIAVVLEAPKLATINQEEKFTVRVVATSPEPQKDLLLRIDYPNGFKFDSSLPEPDIGTNVWRIDSLTKDRPFTVSLMGIPGGTQGDQEGITASVGSVNEQNPLAIAIVYSTSTVLFGVESSLIGVDLFVNQKNQENVAVNSDDSFPVRVNWKNNTKEILRDVKLSVKLSGNAYYQGGINKGTGYFDSSNNKVIFTQQQSPDLATVQPGASGAVEFSIKPSSPILDNTSSSIINPKISVSVDASAISSAGITRVLTDIAKKDAYVNSIVSLVASTSHYSGPISNSGPMPPRVNKETTYTIQLELKNSSNTIDQSIIKFKLPLGVRWTGVFSPSSESVSYDPVTREVAWNIGSLQAGTGFGTESKKIFLQVGLTPSADQLGSRVYLTQGQLIFTGTDAFTSTLITQKRDKLSSEVRNDSSQIGADGKVVN